MICGLRKMGSCTESSMVRSWSVNASSTPDDSCWPFDLRSTLRRGAFSAMQTHPMVAAAREALINHIVLVVKRERRHISPLAWVVSVVPGRCEGRRRRWWIPVTALAAATIGRSQGGGLQSLVACLRCDSKWESWIGTTKGSLRS